MKIDALVTVIGAVVGVGIGFVLNRTLQSQKESGLKRDQANMLEDAKREASTIKKEAALDAKEEVYKLKSACESELNARREETHQLEKRLNSKEEYLERKVRQQEKRDIELHKKEKDCTNRLKSADRKYNDYRNKQEELIQMLEKVAVVTRDEAKQQLMKMIEEDARVEAAKHVMRIEEEAKREADNRSKSIVVTSIQRYASDYVAESTVSYVNLPNEVIKGRIIGREGRNIRALENATGIDLIIDDTPEAVILSGFDAVRREIARVSLERLLADGRIHPARIEEVVGKVKLEIEKGMYSDAEKLLFELGIHDLHIELVKLIGRLKFRLSYGQNNLMHANEVASLAKMMASELKLDVKLAVRAGILHDIGKSVSHTVEGTHALLGADLAKKYGESDIIVNAIASHHNEVEATSPEAVLIAAADALSASRPGARRESFDAYVKRLEKIENLATSFDGINKAYAIQAGREVRIIVKENELDDVAAANVTREIVKKIEDELTYPGQIKVTVIRENRFVEIAK